MAIIGIDLGTSNSAAAVLRGGRPVIIPSAEGVSLGGKAFPSFVAITAEGQTLVGELARRQLTVNPEGTTTAFKRKMGQRLRVRRRDKEFTPEQLSAFLLQKIKRDAEAFLGEPVDKAVITVPAYFDDNQRSATKDAANIAGLEVVRLVNEPTAASLAYGLDRLKQELRIAVVDLGGGTLDVTVMESGKGVFEVKATSGDTQLGGTGVFQGERPFAADNTSLGEFNLEGLAPAPRGVPKIEVTFDIDANGLLDVSAKDTATGKSQSIRITGSTRLTDAEKERMVKEAEKYAEADKKRRAEVEKLNDADAVCYQAEKTLAEHGDKIADDLKKRINSARTETREAIKQKDAALAAERAEKLREALQEVGKKLYAEAAAKAPHARPDVREPGGEPRPSGAGPRGKVVDAEFRETKQP